MDSYQYGDNSYYNYNFQQNGNQEYEYYYQNQGQQEIGNQQNLESRLEYSSEEIQSNIPSYVDERFKTSRLNAPKIDMTQSPPTRRRRSLPRKPRNQSMVSRSWSFSSQNDAWSQGSRDESSSACSFGESKSARKMRDPRGRSSSSPSLDVRSHASSYSEYSNHYYFDNNSLGSEESWKRHQQINNNQMEHEYQMEQVSDVADIFSLTRHNRYHQVEALLDRGIPVDVRDRNGNTILIIACQNGLKRIAKLALRRGADINAQNNNGNTCLHYCFGLQYGDTLGAYLISKGANPNILNHNGRTGYNGFSDRIPS